MDDAGDGGKRARAPEIQDVIKICRALNEQGAKYVLIGGIAVILHGFTRGTGDIDFIVDSSCENIEKIKKALAVLPDNAASMIENVASKALLIKLKDTVRPSDRMDRDFLEAALAREKRKS